MVMNDSQPPAAYSYPAREHLDSPITPRDWIDDEIRVAGADGRQARDNLYTDLNNLYQARPYVKLLGEFASRLSSRQIERDVECGNIASDRALPLRGQSLYSGMLLGVRAELMPAQRPFRHAMLSTASVQTLYQVEQAYNRTANGLLHLPSETHSALWAAASKLFVDLSPRQASRYQSDFIHGYVVTASNIAAARRHRELQGGPLQY